jgi:hypothetical protein
VSSTAAPEGQAPSLPKVTKLPTQGGAAGGRSALDVVAALVHGALIGGVAIALGWLVTEASGAADATSLAGIAVYAAILGAIYGLITSAWSDLVDQIWSRAFERAAIGTWVGLVGGAIAGAIAFLLYDELQEVTADPSGARFYLLRVLAWAVFGAGIGAAPGIAERAPRKVGNGVLGGVIGGAIGGAIFHWASFQVADEADARLLGLVAIGIGIGAATALVEFARRRAWLRVVAGGMAGKEFVLYHEVTDIGSSPKAQITLIKDPETAPLHARIVEDGPARVLHAVAPISVNGAQVRERRLRDGDLVQVGSTTLEYAEVEVE